MYLYREQYAMPALKGTLKVERAGETTIIEPERPTFLREEIGCWRKANQVHAWFVDNVQKGRDDCRDYYVDDDQLSELLNVVNEVIDKSELVPGKVFAGRTFNDKGEYVDILEDGQEIANPEVAKALLPTREGFFFGSYRYDEYYIEDLYRTRDILEKALAVPDEMEVLYSSSW